MRSIFDNKTSVYDVVAKLVFQNETGCDPRLERSVHVCMGEFVEGDDEGRYYPTVALELEGRTGSYNWRDDELLQYTSVRTGVGWLGAV